MSIYAHYRSQAIGFGARRVDRIHLLEQRVAQLEYYLTLQHEITQIIAQASDLNNALNKILQVICERTGWDFAEVWHKDHYNHSLNCLATAHLSNTAFPLFEESGLKMTFAFGKGLPGRVWASQKPAWMMNVVSDVNFLRSALAKQDGLHSGLGIPIRTEGEVIGALTFFTCKRRETDPDLARILETVGSQIGLFIERKRAEQVEQEQARLVVALEERQRLARDLHDSVTQTLFSASVIAEMLPIVHETETETIAPYLHELNQLTRSALSEMRALLVELRPSALVDNNLTELLEGLVSSFKCRTPIDIQLIVQIDHKLSGDEQVTVYRIVQEALNNIWKHAHAHHVSIEVIGDECGLHVVIEDDGHGFDTAHIPKDHFGLQVMRERAQSIGASFQVDTCLGVGTRIQIVR